jgi:hypothetical protein
MGALRSRVVALLLGLAVLTGCASDDPFDPRSVEVTGFWAVMAGRMLMEYYFDLRENPDGTISGVWHYPLQFTNYPVRGHRNGDRVVLVADSPDSFLVRVDVLLVGPDELNGEWLISSVRHPVRMLRR